MYCCVEGGKTRIAGLIWPPFALASGESAETGLTGAKKCL